MADKTAFKTTEKAGAFIAGMRNPGSGKTIMLSEKQAKYPLIHGEIERAESVPEAEPVALPDDPETSKPVRKPKT